MKTNKKYSFGNGPIVRKNPNKAHLNLYKALGAALAIGLFPMLSNILNSIAGPTGIVFAALISLYIIAVTFNFIIIQPGILSLNGFICNYGFANTGAGCSVIQKVAQRYFLVPFYNNAGTQNGIRLNGTISTTTNATFTYPGFGFSVSITFTSTAGFYQNAVLFLTDSNGKTGYFYVKSITDSTHAVCVNMGIVGGAAEGITFATAATVTDNLVFNNNYFTNLINHPDTSQRWYPLPSVKNASNKRNTSIMKAYDDQTEAFVQQGVRKIAAIVPGKFASPTLLGAMLYGRQIDFGIMTLDKDQNLIGQIDNPKSKQWLYPVKIDSNSIDPIYNPGGDKDEQEIMIAMNVDSTAVDNYLDALAGSLNGTAGDIDPGANLANIPALLDVTAIISAIATSSAGTFTVQLKTYFGSALTPVNDTGLVLANLISPVTGLPAKVYDQTAAADIAVTSITERTSSTGRPTGVYDVVLASDPTAGNKISIGIARVNRDYSSIPAQAGTAPNYTFASV